LLDEISLDFLELFDERFYAFIPVLLEFLDLLLTLFANIFDYFLLFEDSSLFLDCILLALQQLDFVLGLFSHHKIFLSDA
jgi:hypothetical protein